MSDTRGDVRHLGLRVTTRVGLARDLVRVLSVEFLGPHASCTNGPLYLARGVRFVDGSSVSWHTTDERGGYRP